LANTTLSGCQYDQEGCSCISGVAVETNCTDMKDNDAQGGRDCQDPDCAGKVCRPFHSFFASFRIVQPASGDKTIQLSFDSIPTTTSDPIRQAPFTSGTRTSLAAPRSTSILARSRIH